MVAMMVVIRPTNKTSNTIIIAVLLSLLVLRSWVSFLFSKKYNMKMELVEWVVKQITSSGNTFLFFKNLYT